MRQHPIYLWGGPKIDPNSDWSIPIADERLSAEDQSHFERRQAEARKQAGFVLIEKLYDEGTEEFKRRLRTEAMSMATDLLASMPRGLTHKLRVCPHVCNV